MPRETIVLSGRWRLQLDPQNEGERAGWAGADYDDSRWREVRAPCSLERGHPDLEWYLGAGWYRRRFHAPQSWRGRRVVLRCEGVNYHAAVWLNGQRVAQNEDGFLPFEAPLAAALRYGQENVLALRADNEARAGEAPGQNVGWRPYGGLLREAALCVTPLCHLAWVRVVAEPLPGGAGRLLLQALARNEGPLPRAGALVVRVLGARGQLIGRLSSAPFALAPGQEAILCVEGELAGVRPWRPADPALYTAQAALRLEPAPGLEQADALSTRLGFRRIETRGAALLLNGEPLRLRGFNRHEDTARRGACTDLATARRDLLHMKALGANFVRLCHYPHHPGELELCDELGLLAMGEIPVYGSTGMAEDEALFRAKMERAARQLTAMVRRDGNHPALIFWSVSNETHEQHPVVVQANDTLIRQARALDPTRLVVHVSDHWQPRRDGSGGCTAFDLDDVLCLNAYPWMGDPELARPARLAEQTAWWRENLARLHALFPHKPILITEFGYVSYEGTYGYLLGEDTHAANLEAAYAGMDAPYVCGATIWCYADHAWPHKLQPPWIGAPAENPISPYGVVTRARKPKALACAAVERMFGARP